MADFFRETFAGQCFRLITHGRYLKYPDERGLKSNQTVLERSLSGSSCAAAYRQWTRHSIQRDASKAESEAGIELVSWIGPDDEENPQNWSLTKKCFVTGLICLLTFSVYIGSAIYTAGEEGITEQFNVSQTVATLGLTLFVFGYGLGPMFLAPFAEAAPIGRMPVYIITLVIFVFFNFGVVYAKNIGMLLAFRFLTGFFGSPVLATGGASMADLWSPKKRAYAIGIWGVFAVFGPVMGPLIGGFAAENMGWTWTIWELIWLSGFCLVVLTFTLPETSAVTILYRRAHRLRKTTGNPRLKSEPELEAEGMQVKDIVIASLWRPFQLCFQEPILLSLNVYLGLIYALLYTWFEAFPIVFNGIYGFDLGRMGLAFLGILVGGLVIMIPYCAWLYYVQEGQFDTDGNIAPEKRLPPAILGSLFIPICMFWFGWTSRESIHWIVPIIGSAFFSMGAVLLFNAILNYQGDAYPQYVGSVLAGNDMMRCAFGGAFPLFAPALFHTLGIGWACSLLGFLAIAFIPFPILFWKYGKTVRMRSRYARHDI